MLHRLVTSVGTDRRNHQAASPGWRQAREGRETSEGQAPSKRGNSRRWKRQPGNPRKDNVIYLLEAQLPPSSLAPQFHRTTQSSMRFPGREVSDDRLSYCKKTVHYFTIPYFKPHYRVSLAVVPCLDERFVRRRRFHGSFGQTFACRHIGALSRFVDRFRSVPERRGRVSARQNRRSRSRREGEDYGQPHPSIEGHHNQRIRLFPNRQYCSLDVHHPN